MRTQKRDRDSALKIPELVVYMIEMQDASHKTSPRSALICRMIGCLEALFVGNQSFASTRPSVVLGWFCGRWTFPTPHVEKPTCCLPDFDFLHLGWEYYAGYKEQTIEKVDIPEIPNLWKGDGMWLTHAYIITNHCALDWLQQTIVQINGLDAMTADMQSGCLAYGFKPAIAYQERGTSGMLRSSIHHTG